MANNSEHNNSTSCFLQWMKLQESDLQELVEAQQAQNDPTLLLDLARKNIQHFQEYMDKRIQLAPNDISPYFAPKWNSSLENSLLWLGGCRPTLFIRLIYALCGSEMESQLSKDLQGTRTGNLGELSSDQLNMVNQLHLKTIKEEEKLTTLLASLQEEVADQPISIVCKAQEVLGGPSEDVERSLRDHDRSMVTVLVEADQLRLNTLTELITRILTPIQAVEFLVVGKKLHICLHRWGKERDHVHGRD